MEDLKEIFEGIESDIMTDDTKLKLSTLFESAVNEAIQAKEAELEEANKQELSVFKEDLVSQCDSYLEYFTKEYIKENEQIVEDFTKVRLAEKVLRNFQMMVEAFNIALSDESVSSEDAIAELTSENTKLVNKLIEARQETVSVKKSVMIAEAGAKLTTDVQREKLAEMAKGLEFEEDIFESKLSVLVEKIMTEKVEEVPEKLEEKEEEVIAPVKTATSAMSSYLKNI